MNDPVVRYKVPLRMEGAEAYILEGLNLASPDSAVNLLAPCKPLHSESFSFFIRIIILSTAEVFISVE